MTPKSGWSASDAKIYHPESQQSPFVKGLMRLSECEVPANGSIFLFFENVRKQLGSRRFMRWCFFPSLTSSIMQTFVVARLDVQMNPIHYLISCNLQAWIRFELTMSKRWNRDEAIIAFQKTVHFQLQRIVFRIKNSNWCLANVKSYWCQLSLFMKHVASETLKDHTNTKTGMKIM